MQNDAILRALAARVGEFHITDRAMKAAQNAIEQALRLGDVPAASRDRYVSAVRNYFKRFSNEARAQLRDVDRRLEQVNQVHFNLTAERGVVVRRIEATQSIIEEAERVGNTPRG